MYLTGAISYYINMFQLNSVNLLLVYVQVEITRISSNDLYCFSIIILAYHNYHGSLQTKLYGNY